MNRSVSLLVIAVLPAGCADLRPLRMPRDAEVVRAAYTPVAPPAEPVYRVGCSDVLRVTFNDHPDWDCLACVGIDGRLPVAPGCVPLVEGGTVEDARVAVARVTVVDPDRVDVRLADARAARVYLTGPENGRQRVVPYRGPEPVVEFLWRVGAVKRGCTDLNDVSVVRPNVAAGGQPETFRVDVEAVVLDHDPATNLVLQPSDQIYIGETRRSRFSRSLPDWLRPLYRKIVGLLPQDAKPRG
ncbi:hypothetical protein [Fimbriiglobus ruber]|uniref:Polysaccharide export protein n=1 Tax=Fimbriiglobus ruber TaxID=1908690 RepID=A0A225DG21_9BACT|nr:hypothetical protein [Fimbriiglobus ruber]OWK40432.1 hypothetical protein FRUB_05351 [Fimbriiglobus ruber]